MFLPLEISFTEEEMVETSSVVNETEKANTMEKASPLPQTPIKKRSPWNVTLIVISILAILALVISIITYSIMKNAEKLYEEQVEELMPIFTKKLDGEGK